MDLYNQLQPKLHNKIFFENTIDQKRVILKYNQSLHTPFLCIIIKYFGKV